MAYTAADSDPAPSGELATPNLARIEEEVRNRLPHERHRLERALRNLEFSKGDFSRAPVRPPGAAYDQKRFPRHSMLMSRVVKVLTANLYRTGPQRTLPKHPQAQEWLNNVYRRHLVDAMFQRADQYAVISDVSAFQVSGSTDPDCPVKVELWDASQFCVWAHPDDPTKPVAVATIDRYDDQARIRLWTAELVSTWLSVKLKPGQTEGGRMMTKVKEEANPYGILPFAFVHFDLPCGEFWGGGPGDHLGDVNDGLNYFLTEHYDCIRYNTRPVIVLKGVRPGWRPPSPIQPGDVWDLPSDEDNAAGTAASEASAEYLQADVSFIGAGWDDFNQFLDHTLEMNGVPPSSIRLEQTAAKSGYAIVVEQIPLILWAETRQRPFGKYEDDLAKVCLTVGSKHLANNGYADATTAQLTAAAADPGLVLRWPCMYPDTPGPERNDEDEWLLDHGLTSRLQILMRREKLNAEEAEERLKAIADELKRERDIFGELVPPDPGKAKPDPEKEELDDEFEEEVEDEDDDEKPTKPGTRKPDGD